MLLLQKIPRAGESCRFRSVSGGRLQSTMARDNENRLEVKKEPLPPPGNRYQGICRWLDADERPMYNQTLTTTRRATKHAAIYRRREQPRAQCRWLIMYSVPYISLLQGNEADHRGEIVALCAADWQDSRSIGSTGCTAAP